MAAVASAFAGCLWRFLFGMFLSLACFGIAIKMREARLFHFSIEHPELLQSDIHITKMCE